MRYLQLDDVFDEWIYKSEEDASNDGLYKNKLHVLATKGLNLRGDKNNRTDQSLSKI